MKAMIHKTIRFLLPLSLIAGVALVGCNDDATPKDPPMVVGNKPSDTVKPTEGTYTIKGTGKPNTGGPPMMGRPGGAGAGKPAAAPAGTPGAKPGDKPAAQPSKDSVKSGDAKAADSKPTDSKPDGK